MKAKTAIFTGHRNIPATELPQLIKRLDKTIGELVNRGVVYFGSGACRGFDQYASFAVLRQKEHNPAVKLILVLPCRNLDALWNKGDRKNHQYLLSAADKVVCLSEDYYDGCYKVRNQHLVRHSGVCVTYMTHGRTGTSQTVRLAREQGLTVINLSTD